MAGPIQKAMSDIVNTASAVAVAGKVLSGTKGQASEKPSAEAEAENKMAKTEEEISTTNEQEAKDIALEADLIRMGADPKSAEAFMNARALGLDTKSFGAIRKKGRFVGTYSSLAEKLSKDALTDSLSSKVINKKGFAERILALSKTRKGRVSALVEASKGGN